MKKGMVVLDTLILNVRYPKNDIYNYWKQYVEGLDRIVLNRGVRAENFVARTGGTGYKFSLWLHDARLYLTDQTDEIRGEGNGMGIRIQLGPKFLIHHIHELDTAVGDLLKQIGINRRWPIRISRLDLAVDLFNIDINNQIEDDWKHNWVGRSKLSKFIYNSNTTDLETINIGSRKSSIYLRNYNKIAQSVKEGDLLYWLDVWKEEGIENVTRVEWEIKTKRGNFSDSLIDFYQFEKLSRIELLNYLVKWGRLGIPCEDTNKSRWETASFWKLVEEIINDWADGVDWPTSRFGKEFKGISDAYVKQVSGTISGAVARLGGENLSIMVMFETMEEYGESIEKILKKAKEKAEIYKRI